jgi:hypothetical protein
MTHDKLCVGSDPLPSSMSFCYTSLVSFFVGEGSKAWLHYLRTCFYNEFFTCSGQLPGWKWRERVRDLREWLALLDVHHDDAHAPVVHQGMADTPTSLKMKFFEIQPIPSECFAGKYVKNMFTAVCVGMYSCCKTAKDVPCDVKCLTLNSLIHKGTVSPFNVFKIV